MSDVIFVSWFCIKIYENWLLRYVNRKVNSFTIIQTVSVLPPEIGESVGPLLVTFDGIEDIGVLVTIYLRARIQQVLTESFANDSLLTREKRNGWTALYVIKDTKFMYSLILVGVFRVGFTGNIKPGHELR